MWRLTEGSSRPWAAMNEERIKQEPRDKDKDRAPGAPGATRMIDAAGLDEK
jgi:hypothetical protein